MNYSIDVNQQHPERFWMITAIIMALVAVFLALVSLKCSQPNTACETKIDDNGHIICFYDYGDMQ